MDEKLYKEVSDNAKKNERISITTVKRRFNLSYVEAAKMIDRMEEEGIIGKHEEGGRRVLVYEE